MPSKLIDARMKRCSTRIWSISESTFFHVFLQHREGCELKPVSPRLDLLHHLYPHAICVEGFLASRALAYLLKPCRYATQPGLGLVRRCRPAEAVIVIFIIIIIYAASERYRQPCLKWLGAQDYLRRRRRSVCGGQATRFKAADASPRVPANNNNHINLSGLVWVPSMFRGSTGPSGGVGERSVQGKRKVSDLDKKLLFGTMFQIYFGLGWFKSSIIVSVRLARSSRGCLISRV